METIRSRVRMDPWRRRSPCTRGTRGTRANANATRTVAIIVGI